MLFTVRVTTRARISCYGMSYNRDFNATVVGPCSAMCKRKHDYQNVISDDVTLLNSELCGEYSREGQLCGRCGPPVAVTLHD